MNKKVSIIMPAYNAEKLIKESIESVINQSYKNWELIIVNDASIDKTRIIVENIIKKEKRIKLINLKENKGVVNARNTALKLVIGTYIAFLDSDDLWYPQKLESQLKFMAEKKCAISYTAYDVITERGNYIKTMKVPSKLSYKGALKGNSMTCLTVVINREKVRKVEMPKIKHEDYATWLNIIKEVGVSYGLNETLGKYRVVKNSMSSNKLKMIVWSWNIYYKSQKLGVIKSFYYTGTHLVKAFFKRYIK